MAVTHVREQFVVTEEAFAAKLAKGMSASVCLLWYRLEAMVHGGHMCDELGIRVEYMLMGENFLGSNTQVTKGELVYSGGAADDTHHMSLL